MMLRDLDENAAADRLKAAVFSLLAKGEARTRDLGGSATTTEMADALLREIERTPAPVG
jgi:isocitrate dehydrogenase (NAD+)